MPTSNYDHAQITHKKRIVELLCQRQQIDDELRELYANTDGLSEESDEQRRLEAEQEHLRHDLQVHQNELQAQNVELLTSQEELTTVRDQYSDLYNYAPVGYLSLNETGCLQQVNFTFSTMLGGITHHNVLHQPLVKFINCTSQDAFHFFWLRLQHSNTVETVELQLQKQDGTTFWARLDAILAQIPTAGDEHERCEYRVTVSDITERRHTDEALQASLREKDVLLKEIHHRVKNNMQVISSLVSLQADTLNNPALRDLFNDLRDQVHSMALVHEKLYQSENLAQVDFAEYTQNLLNYLWRAHGDAAATVRLILNLQPVALTVEKAIPSGLILNELVSNALKHAFPNQPDREVSISLFSEQQDHVHLRVSDNGIGLPTNLNWQQTATLGLRLVQMLTEQLAGTLEVCSAGGTAVTLRFARDG